MSAACTHIKYNINNLAWRCHVCVCVDSAGRDVCARGSASIIMPTLSMSTQHTPRVITHSLTHMHAQTQQTRLIFT